MTDRRTHLQQQIKGCVFFEMNFLREAAKSLKRRITDNVHLGFGIGFRPTDEVA